MGIFDAIRRAAAGEGDSPWYEPQGGRHSPDFARWDNVARSVHRATGIGRPHPGGDPAVQGGRIETGHYVHVGLDYPSETWYAEVSPPSWPRDSRKETVHLHLGHDDEQVPHMLRQRFMHPDVQQYLRDTMNR